MIIMIVMIVETLLSFADSLTKNSQHVD